MSAATLRPAINLHEDRHKSDYRQEHGDRGTETMPLNENNSQLLNNTYKQFKIIN